jgi:hypothetical protein
MFMSPMNAENRKVQKELAATFTDPKPNEIKILTQESDSITDD